PVHQASAGGWDSRRCRGTGASGTRGRQSQADRTSVAPCAAFLSASLPALAGSHDLDIVARVQRRFVPGRARHHLAVERDRDAALGRVDGLFFQQRSERRNAQDLVAAIDADVSFSHGRSYSAARTGAKRSTPNGRIAGSTVPSSTSRAIASAVTGASRIPLR